MLELASENFPVIPVMSRLRSCKEVRKGLGWRIRSQSVLKLHSLLPICGVQSSVVCRDFIKDGCKRPMPGECATVTADEADEYVDVLGSRTPLHS